MEAMREDNTNSIIIREAAQEWPSEPLLPALDEGFHIRSATVNDIPFIDQMQKHFAGSLGFMWDTVLKGHIEKGNVRIIVDEHGGRGAQYGYCLAQDNYMSRDDVGIIYQLAVVPMKHRKQFGAMLIKDFFERAPFGMKLACCWCAQDLPANYFWEAMGFIPLAFRTGSRGKQRIHIFWQRRTDEGDHHTPFWYPKKTSQGAVQEDRLILPIPPGQSWRDAKPVLLPGLGTDAGVPLLPNGMPDPNARQRRRLTAEVKEHDQSKREVRLPRHSRKRDDGTIQVPTSRGTKVIVVDPDKYVKAEQEKQARKPKRKSPRKKLDSDVTDGARDLRDRYLDVFNRVGIQETGKYTPCRDANALPSKVGDMRLLTQNNPAFAKFLPPRER